MIGARCIRLNVQSVLVIVLCVILNGIKFSSPAVNHMEVPSKYEMHKNNSHTDYVTMYPTLDLSFCPINIDCKTLPVSCIKCNLNISCIYGNELLVSCEALQTVQCSGDREFKRTMTCRYCWQTEQWEHSCIQKDNCNSANQYYFTNCSVEANLLCLGHRTFQKRQRCNWTQGYKWSTALFISITLGGFGADRFYLGHWQEGIGKLFSFGGLGVWTLIDVILISLHYLGPADGSLYI